uniref:Superoxide dismutase n=1 Tax=Callorhinchus milii TaxID=7868 RepID=V9KZ99_CALMI
MTTTKAVCLLRGHSSVVGTCTFQTIANGHVVIQGEISGLTPGKHGIHIHLYGDVSDGCASVGPHYNPCNETHGAPQDKKRHVGDLGNVEANENGVAIFELEDRLLRLTGKHNIIGRSVVVHQNEDDLGKGNNEETHITGNVGEGIAWGIIGIDN